MRTKSPHGGVSSAKLGSTVACTSGTAPSGVSEATIRSRLSRSNQKLVFAGAMRVRLGSLSRWGLRAGPSAPDKEQL
jgi:hypothetical protein